MRKIGRSVVVVGAVVALVSAAQAATQVVRLPANTVFATAIWNNLDTGFTTAVFVARTVGQSGPPVDAFSFQALGPDGQVVFGSGVLPQDAFHGSSTSASLNVDLNKVEMDVTGEIPANGVISIQWTATDVQRTAGNVKFDLGNGQAVIAGVRTEAPADMSGTIFGLTPVGDDSNSNISVPRSAVIIITHN